MSTVPLRAAIYLRISLDSTGEHLAISRQREDCRAIANERGWDVVGEYVDNSVSASDRRKDRPGYNRLVDAYEAGEFDAIICWNIDRLTRQPKQLEDWVERGEDRGLLIATANGETNLANDDGVLFAGIKAQIARAEARRMSARRRRAMQQRAELGRPPLGPRLTGYTAKGVLVPDEAAIVSRIFERFHGGDSLRAIAAWLGECGVPTRSEARALAALDLAPATAGERPATGGEDQMDRTRVAGGAQRPWNPSSVRTILTNPRYAGRAIYDGKTIEVQGQWIAIVPEWLFDSVNATLADPRRRKQVGTDRKHLGSGLYVCDVCGRPVRAHTSVPTGGKSQVRYRCPEAHLTRMSEPIDRLVLAAIRLRLGHPDLAQLLSPPDSAQARVAADEIRRQRGRLVQVEADYDNDLIDAGRYKVKREKIVAELSAAEAAQLRLVAPSSVTATMAAGNPAVAFDGASLGMKREVIRFFVGVRLLPAARGRHFDPYSVQFNWLQ